MRQRELRIATISLWLQFELNSRARASVPAVEAAQWLERVGILKDRASRPGLPLRRLLREGAILGQRQESNGRWFVDAVGLTAVDFRCDDVV